MADFLIKRYQRWTKNRFNIEAAREVGLKKVVGLGSGFPGKGASIIGGCIGCGSIGVIGGWPPGIGCPEGGICPPEGGAKLQFSPWQGMGLCGCIWPVGGCISPGICWL